jgi:hypothetical protein
MLVLGPHDKLRKTIAKAILENPDVTDEAIFHVIHCSVNIYESYYREGNDGVFADRDIPMLEFIRGFRREVNSGIWRGQFGLPAD